MPLTNAHTNISSRARGLNFCLSLPLPLFLYLMWMRNEMCIVHVSLLEALSVALMNDGTPKIHNAYGNI